MKRIFRSILNLKRNGLPSIALGELVNNYKTFSKANLVPEDPSYLKILTWIEAHYRKYRELPTIELLYERARSEGEEVVLTSLTEISSQVPYIRSDFAAILNEKADEQNKQNFQALLSRTWRIADSGEKIKKKEIKGIQDAISLFNSEARKYRLNNTTIKTDSQIRSKEDATEVIEQYIKNKKDPLANTGMHSFLDKMDSAFRGIKLGDLFIIAAFVSQGKTTMAANLAYSGIMQGMNGMYFSMEMKFHEMRDLFYCLHTCNPAWYNDRKYKNLAGKISLEKISYSELSEMEEEFFKHCCEDFHRQDLYGELRLFQPSEALTTPSLLEMELYNYQSELAEKGKTLDFVVVDYVGLMVPDKNERYGDFNTDLNGIIKRLKNLAINFNNGSGIRVITPFQVNRDGWKEAAKNDGIYKLTALSSANESERSADQVISLYFDNDMKKNGLVKMCCLKHRKGTMFDPHEIHLDHPSRYIRDLVQKNADGLIDDSLLQEIPVDMH